MRFVLEKDANVSTADRKTNEEVAQTGIEIQPRLFGNVTNSGT